MSQQKRYGLLLFIYLVFTFLFLNLGAYDLSAPDEPRFALVAQEMLDHNRWLLPHHNDRPYPDKPPLFFWSIALFSALAGGEVGAFTARLPSALAALGCLIFMWRWARLSHDSAKETRAVLTVLVLMSSFRFFFQAHMAQIDMLLCFCETAALCLGWRAIQGEAGQKRWAGLFLGLGILAKGPVGWLVPIGAWCVYLFVLNRKTEGRFPKSALLWGLLPPLLWLIALGTQVYLNGQWDYLNNLLFKQTVVRYVNPWHHHRPFHYFLGVVLYDFQPWSFFLIAAIPFTKAARKRLTSAEKYAWAVVVFTLVFFSLSKGKRNLYIVPMYPWAAYLVASKIVTWFQAVKSDRAAPFLWAWIGLLFLGVGSILTALGFHQVPEKYLADYAVDLTALHLEYTGIPLLLTGLGLFVCGFLRFHKRAFALAVAGMVLLSISLYGTVLPALGPERSAREFCNRVSIEIQKSGDPEPQLAMVEYRAAYRFYGDYPIVELKSDGTTFRPQLPNLAEFWQEHPSGWVIIRRPDLEIYLENHPVTFQEIYAEPIGRGTEYVLLRGTRPVPESPIQDQIHDQTGQDSQ